MENERLWVLLAKKKSNEASAEELAELELLLSQNEAAGYEHEVVEKVWEEPLGFLPEMNLNEHTWNNIQTKINSTKKVFSISTATKWMAAIGHRFPGGRYKPLQNLCGGGFQAGCKGFSRRWFSNGKCIKP